MAGRQPKRARQEFVSVWHARCKDSFESPTTLCLAIARSQGAHGTYVHLPSRAHEP